jgi:hypothetical protein
MKRGFTVNRRTFLLALGVGFVAVPVMVGGWQELNGLRFYDEVGPMPSHWILTGMVGLGKEFEFEPVRVEAGERIEIRLSAGAPVQVALYPDLQRPQLEVGVDAARVVNLVKRRART